MAPAPSASAFPLHPNSCLLDEPDRMLFQHSHPTGTDAERTTLQEGVEGFSAAISKAIQPQSHALHLDQRAGTLPTHHRSNARVPGSSSQATKAAEDQPIYYKELTVRCTSMNLAENAHPPAVIVGWRRPVSSPSRSYAEPATASHPERSELLLSTNKNPQRHVKNASLTPNTRF